MWVILISLRFYVSKPNSVIVFKIKRRLSRRLWVTALLVLLPCSPFLPGTGSRVCSHTVYLVSGAHRSPFSAHIPQLLIGHYRMFLRMSIRYTVKYVSKTKNTFVSPPLRWFVELQRLVITSPLSGLSDPVLLIPWPASVPFTSWLNWSKAVYSKLTLYWIKDLFGSFLLRRGFLRTATLLPAQKASDNLLFWVPIFPLLNLLWDSPHLF